MNLADFITQYMEPIFQEWEEFAKSLEGTKELNKEELRDHAKEMLITISKDLMSPQSEKQKQNKSVGKSDNPGAKSTKMNEKAISHGEARFKSGFSVQEVVSEFRALRASVLKQWEKHPQLAKSTNINEINRFNESIDQVLAESVDVFANHKNQQVKLFETVLEISPDHNYILNKDGCIIFANKAMAEQLGKDSKNIVGKRIAEFEDIEGNEWDLAFKKVIQEKNEIRGETQYKLNGGSTLFYEYILTPIVDASGEIEAIAATERDITSRKSWEETIQEKFNAMFTLSPLGMLSNSMEGTHMTANQAFLDMVGYTLEEIKELSCWDITPKKYTDQEDEQLLSLKKIGKYGPYEKEYIHKDGRLIPVRLNGAIITDEFGVKSIWSIIEDITASRQIADSMQLSAMVYEHTSEGIIITDHQGLIISINPAFTKISGYQLEDVAFKHHSEFSFNHVDKTTNQSMVQDFTTLGQWQGEMKLQHKNGELYFVWLTINTIFDKENSVHHHVSIFSDITQKKAAEDLLLQQASYDELTGLPNRRLLIDRLIQDIKRLTRSNSKLALLFLDLDYFKTVNDTLGHNMGDVLLKETSTRLTRIVRQTDTVARLGGDEFVIILSELNDIESVERVVQEILYQIAKPFNLNDEVVHLSASIGIAFFPEDATVADDLIKHADQAMYNAKKEGRNRSSYFTPIMQSLAKARMSMLNDLHSAITKQQFRLHYQPIVELSTGHVQKAEALIRWLHPINGMVSPVDFITLAEETGLIHDIGDWVFREATKQLAIIRNQYDPEFQISINKSPLQFQNVKHSHTNWFDHLKELGLPGKSLVIEITEGLLMSNTNATNKILVDFENAGVELSLDDFGTGYSSLSYLKKYDIDYLKIDRSFVSNLSEDSDDAILCEAIIVMAHKLGIKVIAEGIETDEQKNILMNAGCDYGQGYLFSKPVAIHELIQRLFA